jgi:hypothetical protein
MKLIESKTLGTAAASIEFTSIPQTFTDLVVLYVLRSDTAYNSGGSYFNLTFNGTSANRSGRFLSGDGTGAATGSFTPFGGVAPSDFTANNFSNGSFYLPNYSGNTNKSVSGDNVRENNATTGLLGIDAGLWSDTSAINRLTLTQNAGNFVAGSTAYLYGILKGSDGIVTTS